MKSIRLQLNWNKLEFCLQLMDLYTMLEKFQLVGAWASDSLKLGTM